MNNYTEQPAIFSRSKATRRSLMDNVGFFKTEYEKTSHRSEKRLSRASMVLSTSNLNLEITEKNEKSDNSIFKKIKSRRQSLSRKLSSQKLKLGRRFQRGTSKTKIEEILPPSNCPVTAQSRKRILSTSNREEEIEDVVIWEEKFVSKKRKFLGL